MYKKNLTDSIFNPIFKILIGALIAFAIGLLLNIAIGKILAATFIFKIIKVAIVFVVTLTAYILITSALKVEYLADVKEKLAKKFFKRGNNA